MDELFASGRIVDLILALMVLETTALFAYRKWTGYGIGTAALLSNMAAGACLLFAVRAALSGAGSGFVAGALTAALAMHLFDLRNRWKS